MAVITTRAQLIEYGLRALGKPVIEINVSDDQVEDRVDDALQFYQEFHSDSMIKTYFKHAVTSTDITNKYITLPEELMSVVSVLPIGSSSGSNSNIFSSQYQLRLNDLTNIRHMTSLLDYNMSRQHMALLDLTVNGAGQEIRFSRHMNRLYIDTTWGERIVEGQYVVVEGYVTINPQLFSDVYNDKILKKLVIAYFKRQWGANLLKFEGMQLPGGVTMNGRQIYDDAIQDIAKIEEEMQLKYETPPDFFVG
jgi:hypothetical protein